MDIAPDEYTIWDKFLGGLPETINTWVFANKLSVEYNTLEELVAGAQMPNTRYGQSGGSPSVRNDHKPNQGQFTNEKRTLPFKASNPPALKDKQEINHVKKEKIPCRDRDNDKKQASNPECPENGKKPLYAQIHVAHTIIPDAISESVGAEEHPDTPNDGSAALAVNKQDIVTPSPLMAVALPPPSLLTVRVPRPLSHCCAFFLFGNIGPNASRMFVGLISALLLTVLGGNLRFKPLEAGFSLGRLDVVWQCSQLMRSSINIRLFLDKSGIRVVSGYWMGQGMALVWGPWGGGKKGKIVKNSGKSQ
ncbi:hypothetical protein ARMGADRAFT_1031881 [Armillaria gallica]|uniref:Uncharacterized protein n=1 Tax=Armillaria gallica TaxID=47427 RepID=A0A2H3DK18_ARMGA|nr:hypothetical protein ARMGADRAFT_1031881 [Armillaria gallica]